MNIKDLEKEKLADKKLTNDSINELLSQLRYAWHVNDTGRLEVTIEKTNFDECIKLMNKIAEIAEEIQHHPDLLLHTYKNLTIRLSTHSADGLTERDFYMAKEIDALVI